MYVHVLVSLCDFVWNRFSYNITLADYPVTGSYYNPKPLFPLALLSVSNLLPLSLSLCLYFSLSCVCVCVCRDDDMLSIASMMSVSNLSMIGNLEDDDDDSFVWWALSLPEIQGALKSHFILVTWSWEIPHFVLWLWIPFTVRE